MVENITHKLRIIYNNGSSKTVPLSYVTDEQAIEKSVCHVAHNETDVQYIEVGKYFSTETNRTVMKPIYRKSY